jgi:hypothetical protein
MSRLIAATVDAFNRHGAFTATATRSNLAVSVLRADDGVPLATVWVPVVDEDEWAWEFAQRREAHRTLPKATTVEELVRAVATSVLDEGPKR